MLREPDIHNQRESHLLRGAWIEIVSDLRQLIEMDVAPLTRCVD
mgnify:CR=1 FL=1